MIVLRHLQISVQETNEFKIGDQITVGTYTATCQEITEEGALFLLDQYLDYPMSMNDENTNVGGYELSQLRKDLNKFIISESNFDSIREKMIPFGNGDLLRIPYVEELFGNLDLQYISSEKKQWILMQERKNRIVFRHKEYEWGWLQNQMVGSTNFVCVTNHGYPGNFSASHALGVRPVFLLKLS